MDHAGPVDVLDEILDPVTQAFSPAVAESLVHLRASTSVQKRIDELAEKCNQGELSESEQAEYESYVSAIDLVSILQAKARRWLKKNSAS